MTQTKSEFLLGEFRLIPETRALVRDGQMRHLAKRPYQVLLYLIEHRDRLVTRRELLDSFWDGKDTYEETLTKCIGAIRKALADDSVHPRFIETRYSEGYRYIGDFEEIPAVDRSASKVETFKDAQSNGAAGSVSAKEERLENSVANFESSNSIPERGVGTSTISASQASVSSDGGFKRSRKLLFSTPSALLLAALICAVALFYVERARKSSELPPQVSKPIRTLAVLPLKNLTGDPRRDFFSDGITESLITQLSKADDLRVISRSSVFTFKNKEIDPREIGRQLGVEAVLEGSVRQNKNEVWLDVRLVSATDGRVLLTNEEHKRELRDIFDIQDEISCRVANNLQLLLCGKDAETARRDTSNAEAYEAYLKGRYHWHKRSTEDMKQALKFFEEAVTKDPHYALGYLGLAETYAVMQINRQVPPDSTVARARENAQKALQLNPKLSRAYAIQAILAGFIDWSWAESERLYKQALALDPNDSYAHGWYGNVLLAEGRFDDAETELKRAQELDPLKESIANSLGEIYCYSQQPDRCIAQAEKMQQTFGESDLAYNLFSWAYAEKGDYEGSLHYLERMHVAPGSKLLRAHGLARIGKKMEARQLVEDEINAGAYKDSPFGVAKYYALIGEKEKAFAWLEQACDTHDSDVVSLKIDPDFASLQSDMRYGEILRRIGLM